MPAPSRPSFASIVLIVAGVAWCGLLAAILMLLAIGDRFVGNPFLHLGGWVALTLTGIGHRARCADRVMGHQTALAATLQPRHPVLLSEVTGEMPVQRVYGTAHVDDPAAVAELLPSPATVAAMRRLAGKVTRA